MRMTRVSIGVLSKWSLYVPESGELGASVTRFIVAFPRVLSRIPVTGAQA